MSDNEWYTRAESCALLRVSPRVLHALCEKGQVATNGRTLKACLYAKDWVDGLAQLLSVYPPMRYLDETLFQLFVLWKEFHAPMPGSTRNARDMRSIKVRKATERLVASGSAWRLEEVAAELDVPLERLRKWSRTGRLAAMRIGRDYFLSARYAKYIVEVYTQWLTVSEAAEKLGIWESATRQRIVQGYLPAFKCADGRYRINPKVIKDHIVALPDEPSMSIVEAASRLGCEQRTLHGQISKGRVIAVGPNSRRLITEREVTRWEAWFFSLNPGFEWLQTPITLANRDRETVSLKRASKALKVGTATVGRWAEAGILPFLPDSFPSDTKLTRLFVRRYIIGLQRYARNEHVTLLQAVAYKKLCQERGDIV